MSDDKNPPSRIPKSAEAAEELGLEDTDEELTDEEEQQRRRLSRVQAELIGDIDPDE